MKKEKELRTWVFLMSVCVLLMNQQLSFAQFPTMKTMPSNRKTFLYHTVRWWSDTTNAWKKSEDKNSYYFTFTDVNAYMSDKDGYKTKGNTYKYYGKKDGKIYYLCMLAHDTKFWYVVSEDYKTLTEISELGNNGSIYKDYERISGSSKQFPQTSPSNNQSRGTGKSYSGSVYSPPTRSSFGSSNDKQISKTCKYCHGTGLLPNYDVERHVSYTAASNRTSTYCDRCSSNHYVHSSHENCSVCNGSGKASY